LPAPVVGSGRGHKASFRDRESISRSSNRGSRLKWSASSRRSDASATMWGNLSIRPAWPRR